MATPPTRVLFSTPAVGYQSTASPKTTPTFDVTIGDLIVCIGSTENNNYVMTTPTSTGNITWTLRQSVVGVSERCNMYAWTGVVNATQTGITVSSTDAGGTGGTGGWSFGLSVWRDHGGVGASGKADGTGAPSLAVTCAANSAIVIGSDDWSAIDGSTTRVWRTVNGSPMVESVYSSNPGVTYTVYQGYSPNVGAAGSETVGLTLPTGQTYSILAVEVLGTAGAASPPVITSGAPPDGSTGTAYTFTFTATNSPTWSATGLPDGLSLTTGGVLSGTPTAVGSNTVVVTAANGTSPDDTATYTIDITTAPISLHAAGATLAATVAVTAINPAVPAGTGTGDLSILAAGGKPYGITFTDRSGWTKVGEDTNGTVANSAADQGSTKVAVWTRESATVGAIGAMTIGGTPNTVDAIIHTYAKDPAATWDVTAFTVGADTTRAANFSATGDAGLDVEVGDWVVAVCSVGGDIGTLSAFAIGGMAGATHPTTTLRSNHAVTTGYDTRLIVADTVITAGSSTAAPTFTYTNSSSTMGTVLWLRLRQVPTAVLASGTDDGSLTEVSDLTTISTTVVLTEIAVMGTAVSATDVAGTDAASVSEAATALVAASSVTDSGALTEPARTVVASLARTDAGALAESPAALARSSAAVDAAALSELSSVVQAQLLVGSDSAALTEAAAVLVATLTGRTDSLALTEGAAASLAALLARADSLTLAETDAEPEPVIPARTDTATLSENTSLQIATLAVGVDTLTLTEQAGIAVTAQRTDAAGFAEGAAAGLVRSSSRTDQAAVTETGAAGASALLSRADTLSLSEGVPAIAATLAAADTAALVSETTSTNQGSGGSATDAATLSELAGTAAAYARTDSAALAETSAVSVGKAAVDQATLTEPTRTIAAASSRVDSASLAESAALAVPKSAADSAALAETAVASVGTNAPTAGDAFTLTQNAAAVPELGRGDSAALGELALVQVFTASSDGAGLTESRSLGVSLTRADSGTLTDTRILLAGLDKTDSASVGSAVTVGVAVTADDLALLDELVLGASASLSASDLALLTEESEAHEPILFPTIRRPTASLRLPLGEAELSLVLGAAQLRLLLGGARLLNNDLDQDGVAEVKSIDTTPDFEALLTDGATRQPVDLTTAISVHVIGNRHGANVFNRVVSGPATGIVKMPWQAGDLGAPDDLLLVEVQVVWPDGKIQTFPGAGYLKVRVTAPLLP